MGHGYSLRIIDMEFHRVRGCIMDTGTRYRNLETTLYKHPLRTIIVGHWSNSFNKLLHAFGGLSDSMRKQEVWFGKTTLRLWKVSGSNCIQQPLVSIWEVVIIIIYSDYRWIVHYIIFKIRKKLKQGSIQSPEVGLLLKSNFAIDETWKVQILSMKIGIDFLFTRR